MTKFPVSMELLERIDNIRPEDSHDWCFIAIDIEHFKIFNAWYGREMGNLLIEQITRILSDLEHDWDAVSEYLGKDDFCVFMRYDEERIGRLYADIQYAIKSYSNSVGFQPLFGICRPAKGENITADMYDRALLALEDTGESSRRKIHYYDTSLHIRQIRQLDMLNQFQTALHKDQLTFFLQPQCRIPSGKIVGAEALVRWKRENGTYMPPGEFIPVLEETGFIADMDKVVWSKVYIWLRRILDNGFKPVPISINVSRADIVSMDVAAYLYALNIHYNIPPRLVKIEITESAYVQEQDRVSHLVENLRRKGFKVMMDDFGSGYSSLNMLGSITVDTVKLDMDFMGRSNDPDKKQVKIVESVVGMTKNLRIPVVVEGVEKKEEVLMLENMGCRYVQGYYCYRPMPVDEFEALLTDESCIDYSGIRFKPNQEFHVREFMDENLFTDTMLNNMLGPVAFYTLDGPDLEISRYNQQFYRSVDDELIDARQKKIQNYVFPEDRPELYRMLDDACRDVANGGTCTIRFTKHDGGAFWFHMHLYFLRENDNGIKMFYGQVREMTNIMNQNIKFFDMMKERADYCLRINLTRDQIQYIGHDRSFADYDVPTMNVEEALRITIEKHIPDPEDARVFAAIFDPGRLRQMHKSGNYEEEHVIDFILGGTLKKVRFITLYMQYEYDHDLMVYIFAKAISDTEEP